MRYLSRIGRVNPDFDGGVMRRGLRAAAPLSGALLLLVSTGCPFPADMNGMQNPDDRSAPFLDVDGNFNFSSATPIALAADALIFSGEIIGEEDADIFKIDATVNPGDRVTIDISRTSGNLDAVAAVFDLDEKLVAYNDDRTPNGSIRDPRLDFILPGAAPRQLFLGIAGFTGADTSGNYRVDVKITRNAGSPDPRGQVVYLDYRGGENIVIPNVDVFDLPPFDAADFGEPYEGRSAELKDLIEAVVKDRYAEFNIVVLNSDDFTKPSVQHSTIYFGGVNARAFAISEQIDTLNQDLSDDAIVFSQSYQDAFSITPSLSQMAAAIGNTVAHEIGHLLGLVHTSDCGELMDATCGNDRILSKQTFGDAALDPFVFPAGTQDAQLVLEWVLGLVGM